VDVLIIETDVGTQRAAVDAVKEALGMNVRLIETSTDILDAMGFLGSHSRRFELVICAETVFHSEGGASPGNGLDHMQAFRVERDSRTFIILAETEKPAALGFPQVARRPQSPRTMKAELSAVIRSLRA
jgi:hypothetical protein